MFDVPPPVHPKSTRVFVLPSRNTIGLVAVLAAMWYAGLCQSNGAAYLLCFLLGSLAAVSTIHAWANLRGATVRADSIAPVFAGEEVIVPLVLNAERGAEPVAISIRARAAAKGALVPRMTDGQEQRATLRFTAKQRGRFQEVNLVATSLYPLGLFTARRSFVVRQTWFVYPQPSGSAPIPRSAAPDRQPREGAKVEGDDFAGTRSWLPGESQRHIDWKAAARGQPLLTKQWAGEATVTVLLDWRDTPPGDIESRLGQFARWVQTSERGGASYGLALPGTTLPPSRGSAHFHACLRALAVFSPEESGA